MSVSSSRLSLTYSERIARDVSAATEFDLCDHLDHKTIILTELAEVGIRHEQPTDQVRLVGIQVDDALERRGVDRASCPPEPPISASIRAQINRSRKYVTVAYA